MPHPRARWFKRTGLALIAVFLLTAGAVASAIAFPQVLFAYSATVGRMTVYSDRAYEAAGLERVIADADLRLARSPLDRPADRYSIFVADAPWKRALLFAPVGGVGGVTYYPLSRSNVFLSGADFARNRLIAPTGYIPEDNRTLSYFIAHEITHLQQGALLGTLGYLLLPAWIREGYADRIGLGCPPDHDELAASLRTGPIDPAHWNRFGYYSDFRLVVDDLLDRQGWDAQTLHRARMSLEEARKLVGEGE